MATDRLSTLGLPGRPYGSTARRGGPLGPVTTLSTVAAPGRRYGSFAGRSGAPPSSSGAFFFRTFLLRRGD